MLVAGVVLALVMTADKPTVAAAGISYVNMTDREGDAYIDLFAQKFSRGGAIEVVTETQISQLLGLERQRQLLGCDDATKSSCLAELTGALGAGHVVSGSLGKLGSSYTVSLKLVRADTAGTVASVSERYKTEDALLDGLTEAAARFADALLAEPRAQRQAQR